MKYPDPVQGGRGIQVHVQSFRLYASSQPLPTEVVGYHRQAGLLTASSSPVLPNLAISGLYGVVSIAAAGAAGDFHPFLPQMWQNLLVYVMAVRHTHNGN